jgi:hypothetical protein
MYIGREPQIGNFQVCDAISVVNGQAAYTMQVNSVNVSPETAFHVLCSLNGVLQKPGSSFTVSGSTITFASNLATGDVIDFIQILGSTLDLGVPSDSTVSLAKLTATGTKNATTFLRGDNTFASAGGLTEADQWRLTANITSDTDPISSNLERNDSTAAGYIGSGMAVSSGIWTFPSTGIYYVIYTLRGYPNTNDTIGGNIEATTNNSSYSVVAEASFGNSGDHSNQGTTSAFIDVTDTSNVKVKFTTNSMASGSVVEGQTGYNRTHFTFLKLGDT